ncbi:hypothetical protein CDCA_CDCA08G2315 [Cyanidium caldarium]|uniref:F-box domain-containing protein n=1 Tax=Cyanidium caldarium TaxID=2771 RepID=A0AAV9IVZ5_CYACA|nr:hypothetical protein CDCA_CDCA08G2315 [Cyanidium caldarium]
MEHGGDAGAEHPDSVPYLLCELRHLIAYVEDKPALHDGSASFMRDYLRTLLARTQPRNGWDEWALAGGAGHGLMAGTAALGLDGRPGSAAATAATAHLEIESVDAADDLVLVEPMDASVNLSASSHGALRSGTDNAAAAAAAAVTSTDPATTAIRALRPAPLPPPPRPTTSYVHGNRPVTINDLPDDLIRRLFVFMSGPQLGRVRGVCRKWRDFASDEKLWQRLCLENWRALDKDEQLWDLLLRRQQAHEGGGDIDDESPSKRLPPEARWRTIYPAIRNVPQWSCRLQKTGRFICRLVAHQIGGPLMDEENMPYVLIVERRFNLSHLEAFVLREAAVFYFEPERKDDEEGYQGFIDYLIQRTRAGLALDEDRRIIFIPPCDYSQHTLKYAGSGLLGVVQHAYPPLAS